MPSVENGTNGHAASPKIVLYTSHKCPFAHRAHITLRELNLPYEEVFIDLDQPREPWYLEINPRGLVPSIKYSEDDLDEEILIESQIVTQFLADRFPSPLCPAPGSSPRAALFRARLNFFMDTWNTKIMAPMHSIFKVDSMEEKIAKCQDWAKLVEKELDPLLADANPFFGGSSELTLAEVHVAPFLLRIYGICDDDLLPVSFKNSLDQLPHFGKWARATMSKESVTEIWDEATIVANIKRLVQKLKAAQAKKTPDVHLPNTADAKKLKNSAKQKIYA